MRSNYYLSQASLQDIHSYLFVGHRTPGHYYLYTSNIHRRHSAVGSCCVGKDCRHFVG